MEKYLIGICGHLIRIVGDADDHFEKRVYLVHETAQEFLLTEPGVNLPPQVDTWQHSFDIVEAHRSILIVCSAILHHTLNQALWNYAVQKWPVHGRGVHGSTKKFIKVDEVDYILGFSAMDCARAKRYADVKDIPRAHGAKTTGESFTLVGVPFSCAPPIASRVVNVELTGDFANFGMIDTSSNAVLTPQARRSRMFKYSMFSPCILFDSSQSRGWLVSEFHVTTQMTMFLERTDHDLVRTEEQRLPFIEETLNICQKMRETKLAFQARGRNSISPRKRYLFHGFQYIDLERAGNFVMRSVWINERPPWWDIEPKSLVLFGQFS